MVTNQDKGVHIVGNKKERNFRMRKFKKALAFALASAMIVSVVPVSAATSNTATSGKSTIYAYTLTNDASAANRQTWIKTTTKTGYTVKYFNQTASIVSLNKTSGKVVAKKAGTAKIKVNFYKNGKYVASKVVSIAVKTAPVAKGIKLEKDTLTVGETTKVTTSNDAKVYCYSADKSVVTVNKTTGEVTAVGAGTTKIAVRNTVTMKRVYVDVTVNAEFAAKQTGSKEITVTGSNFTTESKISIVKGSQTVTFDAKNVVIDSEGKTMKIVTNSNILDAEYKVTVDGKEATFKGEASKVAKIEAGDLAIADGTTTLPATASGTAIVNYTVTNQFGEDITKTTTVDVSSNRLKSSSTTNTGKIELNVVTGDKEGDLIPLVIIEKTSVTTLSKNVKLSAQAAITEFSVKGLYNKDGKTYTEDTAKTDDFYLLLSVKDQYGNSMKAADVDLKSGNDLIVSVAAGVTGLDKVLDKDCTVEDKTVDGVQYVAVKLGKSVEGKVVSAGTATVTFISKKSGKVATGTVTVADGIKVDKLTVTPSDLVLADQKNRFEFTAVDTYGNTIEDVNVLNKLKFPVTDSTGKGTFKFVKDANTGKVYLEYDATGVTTGIKAVVFITSTNQPLTVQFNVQAAAAATTIVGVKDVATGIVSGQSVVFEAKNIKFEDQYGQEYTKEVTSGLTYELEAGKDVFTGSNGSYTATKSGDQKLTITYEEGTVKSQYTVTLSSRSLDDLGSFKVEAKNMAKVTTADAATDITSKLTVTGTASDGTVITLPATAYTAYVNGNDASAVSGSALGFADSKKETKDVNVSVIIGNKAGTEVTATVKASNTTPVATTVSVNGTTTLSKGTAFTAADAISALKVVDQYGDLITATDIARVKFTGLQNSDTVTNNNTKNAAVTVNSDVNSITVDYTFDSGLTYTATFGVQ